MKKSSSSIVLLLLGVALISVAVISHFILLESNYWGISSIIGGLSLSIIGGYKLRQEVIGTFRAQRVEILLTTIGLLGIIIAVGYLSHQFSIRVDMTKERTHSLSEQTINMLQRLDKPVHIIFFHDAMMRETSDLYQLMASYTNKVTVEFLDPMVNPAQARMRGIEFAGTAVMESEGRTVRVNGPTEIDIANGILRVSQAKQQTLCFLEGHAESDPFSLEHHDHFEAPGETGHSHGLDTKVVLHERHGMGKARNGLESMNYKVRSVRLLDSEQNIDTCAVLIVAGPQMSLRPREIKVIETFLENGGNALFMLDPFIQTGLEPLIKKLGVILDDTLIIDEASHFWTDISAPAVTNYNRHAITEGLPLTFFMGSRSLSPTNTPVPGSSVRPIINSSKRSYAETNKQKAEFQLGVDKPGPNTIMVVVVRSPKYITPTELTNNKKDITPERSSLEITKKSRIAIIGDSDFATNSFFHILGNGNLFFNTVNYLSAQENLIGIEPKTYDQPRVNLTNRQMKGTFFLSMIFVPGMLALIGIAVWWRQR